MSGKLCGSCKHWDGGPEPDEDGVCLAITYVSPFLLACNADTKAKAKKLKAFVSDEDCYDAHLECKADFGCVLHEPKEDQA